MSINYFKANKSNTGICCSFAVNTEQDCFFINLQRQTGDKQFKGGKRVATKINMVEAGGILTCIERNKDQEFIHKTDLATTHIFFQRYFEYDKVAKKSTDKQLGFSLSITRAPKEGEKETFRIGFNYGEAAALREYLKWGLMELFKFQTETNKQEQAKRVKNKAEESKGEPDPAEPESEESNESEPVQEEAII